LSDPVLRKVQRLDTGVETVFEGVRALTGDPVVLQVVLLHVFVVPHHLRDRLETFVSEFVVAKLISFQFKF
jgi:hypothetical protein